MSIYSSRDKGCLWRSPPLTMSCAHALAFADIGRLRIRRLSQFMDSPYQSSGIGTRCCIRTFSWERGQGLRSLAKREYRLLSLQGPLVHVACCMAFFLSKVFRLHHNGGITPPNKMFLPPLNFLHSPEAETSSGCSRCWGFRRLRESSWGSPIRSRRT